MNAIEVLRSNLADSHWLLEQTIEDISAEHLHWAPPGTANSIAATYAHVIGTEDDVIQGVLQGRRLLDEGEWRGRNGISLPIPKRGSDWFSWSRRVRVDLPATRLYGQAVYAATDAYLASLSPDQLGQLPDAPLPGSQTLCWVIHNLVILHAGIHTGEIAVLKGLQGLTGYP